MVIFGATGDLTKRKLIPALLNLAQENSCRKNSQLWDSRSTIWTQNRFASLLAQEMPNFAPDPIDLKMWEELSQRIYFVKGDFQDPASVPKRLKQQIDEADKAHDTGGNKFFYLAVAPRFFAPIVDQLGAAGLTKEEERPLDPGDHRKTLWP